MITNLMASVLRMDVPVPTPVAPPGVGDKVQTILNWTFWGAIVVLVGALIVAGATMAINNRRGDGISDGIGKVVIVLIGAAIVASASGIIGVMVG